MVKCLSFQAENGSRSACHRVLRLFLLCLNEKCVIIVTITMKRKLEVKNLDQPLYRKKEGGI